ncbi:MAG: hypothetical protein AB1473_09695 [Thermodesulfobacteriota bacterium]
MKHLTRFGLIAVLGCLLVFWICSGTSAAAAWGESVGPVSATVRSTDTPSGLTVRYEPSAAGAVRGYLPAGTDVQGYARFRNGWMKLRWPHEGGWVRVDSLQPRGGAGVVVSVDQPDNCLRIRSGPSSATAQVGCARGGAQLRLTGVWSENNWAEVRSPAQGWVYAPQIASALKPPYPDSTVVVRERTYVAPPLIYSETPVPVTRYYATPGPYYYRDRYGPYRGYRSSGPGVYVGPRGGVAVNAGPVAVRVGPRGGWGVRVGR